MIETLVKNTTSPIQFNSNPSGKTIKRNSPINSLRSPVNTNLKIQNNLKVDTSMQKEDIPPLRSFSPRQDSILFKTNTNDNHSIDSVLSSNSNSSYSFIGDQSLLNITDNESNLDALLTQDLTLLKSEENVEQSSFAEFDNDSLKRLLRHYCLDNLCITEQNRHLKRDFVSTKMNNDALKKLIMSKDSTLQKIELEKQQLEERVKWLEITLENHLNSKHLAPATPSSKSSSNPNLPLSDAVSRTSTDSNGKPSIETNIVKNIWFKFKKNNEGKHLESEDIDTSVLDMMDSSISGYSSDTPLSPTSALSPRSKSKSKIFSSLSWSHSPPYSRKSLDLESNTNPGSNTMSRAEMRSMLFSKPEVNPTLTNAIPAPTSPPASPASLVSPSMKPASSPITPSPEKSKSSAKSNRISFSTRPKSRYNDFCKQQEDDEETPTDIVNSPSANELVTNEEENNTPTASPRSTSKTRSDKTSDTSSSARSSSKSRTDKMNDVSSSSRSSSKIRPEKSDDISSPSLKSTSKPRPDKPLPPLPHTLNIKKQSRAVVRRKSSRRRTNKPLPLAPNPSNDSELSESSSESLTQLPIQNSSNSSPSLETISS